MCPARFFGTGINARRPGEFPAKPRAWRETLSSPPRQPGPRARNLGLHSNRGSFVAFLHEKKIVSLIESRTGRMRRVSAQAMGVRHAALAGAAGWTWGVFTGAVKSGRTRANDL